ncbi:MAG: hypothetical protein ACYC63_06735 [Armatimonadota bacterium]
MSDDIRRDIRTDPTVYDAGPSGTAVAGLIIGLIALAVALYAAFAPRETVREVSQTVMEPIERATTGQDNAPPADQEQARQPVVSRAEVDQEISKIKQELADLRAQVVSGLEANRQRPEPAQSNAPKKPDK